MTPSHWCLILTLGCYSAEIKSSHILYFLWDLAIGSFLHWFINRTKLEWVTIINSFLINYDFSRRLFLDSSQPHRVVARKGWGGCQQAHLPCSSNTGNARATQLSWKETFSLQSNSARPSKSNTVISVTFLRCIHHRLPFALPQTQMKHYTSLSLHARFLNPLAAVSIDNNAIMHQGVETVVCTYMSLWQHPSGVTFACCILQSTRKAILSVTLCSVRSCAAGTKPSEAKGETERKKLRLATCCMEFLALRKVTNRICHSVGTDQ